jgi:hypothetical protein
MPVIKKVEIGSRLTGYILRYWMDIQMKMGGTLLSNRSP